MTNKTYTINIGNLKVSGSAEDLFALSKVYGLASCEYDNWIDDEINKGNRRNVIADLKSEQKELDNIGKQLIDIIRDSEFYKKHTSEMSDLIDKLLEEIEKEEKR